MRLFFLSILIFGFGHHASSAQFESIITRTIDEWLSPELQDNREVIKSLFATDEAFVEIPTAGKSINWGYSFQPNQVDALVLVTIAYLRDNSEDKPRVLDIGAGHGFSSLAYALAGAQVFLVDINETVADVARENMLNGLTAAGVEIDDTNETDFFQVAVQDVTTNYSFLPAETYDIIVMNSVVHFMTPDKLEALVPKIYDALYQEGKLFVQCDSPYHDQMKFDFYHRANPAYPNHRGFAVYSRSGNEGESTEGLVVDAPSTLSPGIAYRGRFEADGSVTNERSYFHNVKNVFTSTDLANLFLRGAVETSLVQTPADVIDMETDPAKYSGFEQELGFSLDEMSTIIDDDDDLVVGKIVRSVVILRKK